MAFRVLLTDDSPAMRAFIRRVMELSGFAVSEWFEAGDGGEALELLRCHKVDVILTDINMPRMDGVEMMRRLESEQTLKNIPVVVISTDSTEKRVEQMTALGARGYLKKPFRPEELRDEMERVLELRND